MEAIGWIIAAAIAGVVIGALSVWLTTRAQAGPGHSVRQLREENERFRGEVNDHFVQTAELINRLTDSYKAVFDHLSEGAERLVDDKVIAERMPQVSDQEIRLRRIGAPSKRGQPTEPAAGKPKDDHKDDAKADSKEDSKASSKAGSKGESKPDAKAEQASEGKAPEPESPQADEKKQPAADEKNEQASGDKSAAKSAADDKQQGADKGKSPNHGDDAGKDKTEAGKASADTTQKSGKS